jgi:hypothetical protein
MNLFTLRTLASLALLLAALPSALAADASAPRCYLFSYFIGNGEDGLHLAWSTNAYRWEALKGGRSFLTPRVGESKLMRDPSLLRAPDGTFHMVWTTAWKGKTIGYAHSKDLVNWSEQQALPVMAHEPETENCWAPELFHDRAAGQYLIFWATTLKSRGAAEGKDGGHRLYYITTKDFQTFSPAKLFFDPGFSVIDGILLERAGKTHLIFKDERAEPTVKKCLQIAHAAKAEGPWTDISPAFTKSWVEGPTCLAVGDEVIVYFDCYRDHHYGAMKSKDLVQWEDVTARLSMPKGIRHGTALEVPRDVIDPLLTQP